MSIGTYIVHAIMLHVYWDIYSTCYYAEKSHTGLNETSIVSIVVCKNNQAIYGLKHNALFSGQGADQGNKTLAELYTVEKDFIQTQRLPPLSTHHQGGRRNEIVCHQFF